MEDFTFPILQSSALEIFHLKTNDRVIVSVSWRWEEEVGEKMVSIADGQISQKFRSSMALLPLVFGGDLTIRVWILF
ncbi:hypothetical protein IHE45_10G001700 [Dioscorea alata]|uniref:Uncharacterized protein n=1 Tax=Dioscorea alata TaxID=55571 RepID=A0ACB7V9A3_DIOAL|nr:hypothetical protein IHE45_10G001700 [Dioscorea alata]